MTLFVLRVKGCLYFNIYIKSPKKSNKTPTLTHQIFVSNKKPYSSSLMVSPVLVAGDGLSPLLLLLNRSPP